MQQLGDVLMYVRAMHFGDALDITLVTAIFAAVLHIVRGTRAVQLLRGILVLVLLVFVFSRLANLRAFQWLLGIVLPALLISVPVIFQPELRRALERLGRAGLFLNRPFDLSASDAIVSVVALAARDLSSRRHGAIMVVERETGLGDLAEHGLRLDAAASVDLLAQIFYPGSPLHDGAVIIRDGRVLAARVVLPLTDSRAGDGDLGTRHLAACSVTENSDAVAVVVSEETGTISLARSGVLVRHLDEGELSRLLRRWLILEPSPAERLLRPLLRGNGPLHRPVPDGDEPDQYGQSPAPDDEPHGSAS